MRRMTMGILVQKYLCKLMQKYAIPCIISLLVGALYNIVDQIFIANASYLGSYGNAANTVVFPLTVVALAIAVMIGDGCCAFVSISLGQNEVYKAKQSVGNAVVMCLISSILLTAIYLIFADTILAMFGGTVNAETYHHSQEYFFYITLVVPHLPVYDHSGLRQQGLLHLPACKPWAKRQNPRLFPWCVRSCLAWALPCCCLASSVWTAFCTPCRCRIF